VPSMIRVAHRVPRVYERSLLPDRGHDRGTGVGCQFGCQMQQATKTALAIMGQSRLNSGFLGSQRWDLNPRPAVYETP